MPMPPTDSTMQLSIALNLPYYEQDWGIINANPDRLDEFMSYYDGNRLLPAQRYDMGELVLASANEAALRHTLAESEVSRLMHFISEHASDFREILDYWISLDNVDEFPIAKLLQERLPTNGS